MPGNRCEFDHVRQFLCKIARCHVPQIVKVKVFDSGTFACSRPRTQHDVLADRNCALVNTIQTFQDRKRCATQRNVAVLTIFCYGQIGSPLFEIDVLPLQRQQLTLSHRCLKRKLNQRHS
jgi:hypothetical protein